MIIYMKWEGHTGWSTETGLEVLSRATFHSRNMSIALALATSEANNAANIAIKWHSVDAIWRA